MEFLQTADNIEYYFKKFRFVQQLNATFRTVEANLFHYVLRYEHKTAFLTLLTHLFRLPSSFKIYESWALHPPLGPSKTIVQFAEMGSKFSATGNTHIYIFLSESEEH